MGLGKTIMTISLLLAHTEKGGSLDKDSTSEINGSDQSSSSPKKKQLNFLVLISLESINNHSLVVGILSYVPWLL